MVFFFVQIVDFCMLVVIDIGINFVYMVIVCIDLVLVIFIIVVWEKDIVCLGDWDF